MFIELDTGKDGKKGIINLNNVVEIQVENSGSRIYFVGDEFAYADVLNTYSEIKTMLLNAGIKIIE